MMGMDHGMVRQVTKLCLRRSHHEQPTDLSVIRLLLCM